jgi:hypothetical protein
VKLLAVLEHHTLGACATDEDVRHRSLRSDLDPAARAAPAMAFEMAPVPPRASPHDRNAPSISPM